MRYVGRNLNFAREFVSDVGWTKKAELGELEYNSWSHIIFERVTQELSRRILELLAASP